MQECDAVVLTMQYHDLTVRYCELSDMAQNFLLRTGLFQEETAPRKDRTLPSFIASRSVVLASAQDVGSVVQYWFPHVLCTP